ncbi:MAG: glycoside hydrolase family 65 protein [Alphaproteobacteria bacterium]|jgi:trehalose/maltose hydrolase-like predicted phosphorylase|nr:glycoside hydrolase family 65 protein [Alphaproteobacteria bacterium]MDP6515377.1 glycoside hydrolase family 65 protein [Alphaproteobacteria bacterium]
MTDKDDWVLRFDGFDPAQEGLREALCTLGNGIFATRGAAAEAHADDIHYPGTYLAGGYNRLETRVADRTVTNEDLVNCPNWLPLTYRLGDDDRWFNLRAVEITGYCQELDLRQGLLSRHISYTDPSGHRFTVRSRRLVHMADPHLAATETTVTSLDWSGPITFRSGLDGSVVNAGVARYRALAGKHLEMIDHGAAADGSVIHLLARTSQSRIEIALAARTRLYRGDAPTTAHVGPYHRDGFVATDITDRLEAGTSLRIEKVAALFSSRDPAISESATEAGRAVAEAGDFEALKASHARAWAALWGRCDITLTADDHAQTSLRLNIFHLLQTISPNTVARDVGVPARGLHGEAYRGHVFWDELFIFPSYTGKLPDITRALLMYRYRRLGAARRLAAAGGFRGAMYPWQSGSNGDEETQSVHLNPRSGRWLADNSRLQRHVNLAVAYNVWRYVQATGDRTFLHLHGAEMLIEIARFLDSLCLKDAPTGRYQITGVMGPDEYHDGYPDRDQPGIDNNAYTNVMCAWVLTRTLQMLDELAPDVRRELAAKLKLTDGECDRWRDITRRMLVPFHDGGIISQFQGYEKLEPFDWPGYRAKYGDIARLDRILEAEGDNPNRYQLSKQADVCMLFFLLPRDNLESVLNRLGYGFDDALVRRNVEYYLARTSHGSTLSSVVHASVLAAVDPDRAWPLFHAALRADQRDALGGTTREGIHLGAMAGAVDIIERAYAGIDRLGAHLRINPRLPRAIETLTLKVNFRRRWYTLRFAGQRLHIGLAPDGGDAATVAVLGLHHTLEPGGSIAVDLPPRQKP